MKADLGSCKEDFSCTDLIALSHICQRHGLPAMGGKLDWAARKTFHTRDLGDSAAGECPIPVDSKCGGLSESPGNIKKHRNVLNQDLKGRGVGNWFKL